MAENTHADHRPPAAGQEAGVHIPGHFGTLYPVNDFIAVIDEWTEAQQAVQELRSLGITDDDLDLRENADARVLVREAKASEGFSEKFKRAFSQVFSDDAMYHQSLMEAINSGGHLLIVHVTDDVMLRAVGEVMLRHHARVGRYYRKGNIEDLV
jgi:hypothetical protein